MSVLSQPEKRAIYDVYGKKGLEADWQVVPRTRTPAEIIEEYQRLQKENAERKLQQSTNPRVRVFFSILCPSIILSSSLKFILEYCQHVRSKEFHKHHNYL